MGGEKKGKKKVLGDVGFELCLPLSVVREKIYQISGTNLPDQLQYRLFTCCLI